MLQTLTIIEDIDAKSAHHIAIVQLCGAVQGESGNQIFDEIDRFAKAHPQVAKYIFDLADLTALDSHMICNLIYFFQQLKDTEKSLVIARPDPEIAAILDNVGVSKAIEVYNHLEEAKAALCGTLVF